MDPEHPPVVSHLLDRRSTRLGPFVALAVTIGLMAGAAVSATLRHQEGVEAFLLLILYGGSASLMGVIILRSRPGHGIGRIFVAGSLIIAVGFAALEAAQVLLPSSLPGPVKASLILIATAGPGLGIVLLGPVLAGAFPSGRFGPTARRVGLVLLAVLVPLVLLSYATTPTLEIGGLSATSPFYVRGSSLRVTFDLGQVMIIGYGTSLALAMIGIALRHWRADAVGRRQIRWVGMNLLVSVVLLALAYLGREGDSGWLFLSLAFLLSLLIPVSIAIAILRYRLYDLDRIVSKTVVYGLVTVVPFSVVVVVNVGLQSMLHSLTGDGPLAMVASALHSVTPHGPAFVAATTLLVAALFNPLRQCVQSRVDRRFHRARYDAERLVVTFAGRLRDELDPDHLAAELTRTAAAAVEPTTMSIWLRTPRIAVAPADLALAHE